LRDRDRVPTKHQTDADISGMTAVTGEHGTHGWLQQEFDATALGRFAEGFVSGCQGELPSHCQSQIRGIIVD
jgi:hypothetical protein